MATIPKQQKQSGRTDPPAKQEDSVVFPFLTSEGLCRLVCVFILVNNIISDVCEIVDCGTRDENREIMDGFLQTFLTLFIY